MCVCGPLCTPPRCDPGCKLERQVPDDECPRCVCRDVQVKCSPVRCPPTCRQGIGATGCPSCICEPMCSPPKCDFGCYVDPDPKGLCPDCICPSKDNPQSIQCAPVECGPLCHVAYFGSGCPTCICDPLCSTPHCNPGCRLKYDPQAGPCPHCECPPKGIQCSIPVCAPCAVNFGSKPCPSCDCSGIGTGFDPLIHGVQCTPPQCDEPECKIDYTGIPCPDCVCDGNKGFREASPFL
ncbi:keratin-associated protein 16-1-like [Uloborus diversus]|uniref:keratin-associated protein 16-1-like n=1 Tax=Uloborus diversus TaxID=327109 RepID=UPI00240995ED|nr:keratin-associated protein 16-1-like [Uloborus diversus]